MGSPFHGEGCCKVWVRLRYVGVQTGPLRVLRVMRELGLLAHQRTGSPRGPRAYDSTITTERVDEMWGTDMTAVATVEGLAAFGIGLEPVATNASLIAVDHCSAECIGIHASTSATRCEVLERFRQGVLRSFGTFGKDIA